MGSFQPIKIILLFLQAFVSRCCPSTLVLLAAAVTTRACMLFRVLLRIESRSHLRSFACSMSRILLAVWLFGEPSLACPLFVHKPKANNSTAVFPKIVCMHVYAGYHLDVRFKHDTVYSDISTNSIRLLTCFKWSSWGSWGDCLEQVHS